MIQPEDCPKRFFKKKKKKEHNCFSTLCSFLLYDKVNQLHVCTCLLPLEPPSHLPPLQVITEHRAELPVLYCRFPLAIYFTQSSVYIYMSARLSQFIPPSPSPTSSHVHSQHLGLYSCPVNRVISFADVPNMFLIDH